MVTSPVPSPRVALVGVLRFTDRFSLPSSNSSLLVTTSTVLLVSPGRKVSVPLLVP